MKTEHLGLRVTQAPGIEHITVEPDAASANGVHVMVKFQGIAPMSFGVEELGELIAALEVANGHAEFMVRQNRGD